MAASICYVTDMGIPGELSTRKYIEITYFSCKWVSAFADKCALLQSNLLVFKEFPCLLNRDFQIDKKGISGILSATGENA